ncbi:MAG: efflux RND transporter permease subunit [Sandaracinus sp.]|nr:efflux RND transporter permease subunit [Sandaracinus sp.]
MSFLDALLERPRITLGLAFLLSLLGVAAWSSMPREEDPRLARRIALVVAPYPGAEVTEVERLVVRPIEDALAEVPEVKRVQATVRTGVAVLNLELRADVTDDETDAAWREVRDALDEAHAKMPAEALVPTLDDDVLDTESVLVALRGAHDDVLALADAADALEARLLALPDVSRVVITGDPGARVTVDVDDAAARDLGVDPLSLAEQLRARNVSTPGGTLALDERVVAILPEGSLDDVAAIAALPVRAGGSVVPLGSFARVRRTVDEPASERARHDGAPAVVVGVVPRPGLQAERFGDAVRAEIDAFDAARDDVDVAYVAFQPAQVASRLEELGASLLLGVGIVALVVLLAMGLRMGLVVASLVPLVTFASVAIYAASGGILHQMAVAALVVALGLLVDNAIVVAETMQRRLDEGASPADAMRATVRELAIPLGSATATTLASFVPMLLSEGTSGDFTRAIPIVVMLTLAVSYGYALLVTPLVARFALRPTRGTVRDRAGELGGRLAGFAVRRPKLTLSLALAVIFGAASFAPRVRLVFFPASDRDQLVVEVELPEGAPLDRTDAAARRLEHALGRHPDVAAVTTFVGRSTPPFYYNLPRRPNAPNLAHVVVRAANGDAVPTVARFAEDVLADAPEALVVARPLEQGPPVLAPVEVRLEGSDLVALEHAAERVHALVRDTHGTRSVRRDQGLGAPTLRFDVDDAEAGRQGVDRRLVALGLLGHARGLPAGSFRGSRDDLDADPIPLTVRASLDGRTRGQSIPPSQLVAVDVPRPGAPPIALPQVASARLEYAPAVVQRRDRSRVVRVLAETDAEVGYASVVAALRPKLEALDLPDGVRWAIGGAQAESDVANAALGAKAPLAALLLIAILLAQFDSFRRVAIVLATAPLAALGIWPGLYALGLPFGFVALLGAIALIGIAVNAAIVLLDVVDARRREGASVRDAVIEAVRLRTRPILLTTATTVAGLVPLLFSASTLWPPMAAAMISGLLVATVLSLAVVPALYVLLFRERPRRDQHHAAPVVLGLMLVLPGVALAQPDTVLAQPDTVLAQPDTTPRFDLQAELAPEPGSRSPSVDVVAREAVAASPEALRAEASIARARAEIDRARVALWPELTVGARYTRLSPTNNDPLVSVDPSQAAAARALLPGVDDDEARLLLSGLVDASEGLADARIEVPRNQAAFGVSATYPVSAVMASVWPRVRGARAAADAEEDFADARTAEVALRAREAWHELHRARALRALARHRRSVVEDDRRRLALAVRSGAAPELDLRRIEARVAEAEIAETSAEAGVAVAHDAVSTLLSREEAFAPSENLDTVPELPADLEALRRRALRDRPELRGLRKAIEAREALARGARNDRFPVLGVAANLDVANPNPRFVPQRTRFDATWDVSVVVRWSPSWALRSRAETASAEATLELNRADLAALEDAVGREVVGAWHTLRASRDAHALAARAVAAAEAAHEGARRRWLAGAGGVADVLDAETALTGARVRRIDAALDARIAAARLDRALGQSAR